MRSWEVKGGDSPPEASAHNNNSTRVEPQSLDLAPASVYDHLSCQCPVQPAVCVNASMLSLH